MTPRHCLKCSVDTAAEICPQCQTPTIDRTLVPDSIIQVHQFIRQWKKDKFRPFFRRVTHGERETRV